MFIKEALRGLISSAEPSDSEAHSEILTHAESSCNLGLLGGCSGFLFLTSEPMGIKREHRVQQISDTGNFISQSPPVSQHFNSCVIIFGRFLIPPLFLGGVGEA